MENFETPNKIWGGDFNLTLDLLDRNNTLHNNSRSAEIIQTYMEETETIDIWRIQNPDKKMFTWHKNRTFDKASRIDMFLISAGLTHLVTGCTIQAGCKSDHSLLTLTLKWEKKILGKGTWKLNNQYLNHKEYKARINDTINKVVVEERQVSPDVLWDLLKNAIINESISYAIEYNKQSKSEFLDLCNKLHELLNQNYWDHEHVSQQIIEVQNKLENHIEAKTRSAIFRSRARWHIEGERSSKYFFALEKTNYNKKVMQAIRLQDNTITNNHKAILREQARFYRNLCKSSPEVQFALVNETDIKINQEQRQD